MSDLLDQTLATYHSQFSRVFQWGFSNVLLGTFATFKQSTLVHCADPVLRKVVGAFRGCLSATTPVHVLTNEGDLEEDLAAMEGLSRVEVLCASREEALRSQKYGQVIDMCAFDRGGLTSFSHAYLLSPGTELLLGRCFPDVENLPTEFAKKLNDLTQEWKRMSSDPLTSLSDGLRLFRATEQDVSFATDLCDSRKAALLGLAAVDMERVFSKQLRIKKHPMHFEPHDLFLLPTPENPLGYALANLVRKQCKRRFSELGCRPAPYSSFHEKVESGMLPSMELHLNEQTKDGPFRLVEFLRTTLNYRQVPTSLYTGRCLPKESSL